MNIDHLIQLVKNNKEDIDEHLLTLFSLVLSMKPRKVIELGVRTARSTYAFLLASEVVNCDVISVDINDPAPSFSFTSSMASRWKFIKSDALQFLSNEFEKEWNSSIGNILYIDDWHSGDHVKREIELVQDFITPDDLILLHDLMYGNSQPNYRSVMSPKDKQWDNGGPYKAVADLDLDLWEYATIPRCHGMTLLRKKGRVLDR